MRRAKDLAPLFGRELAGHYVLIGSGTAILADMLRGRGSHGPRRRPVRPAGAAELWTRTGGPAPPRAHGGGHRQHRATSATTCWRSCAPGRCACDLPGDRPGAGGQPRLHRDPRPGGRRPGRARLHRALPRPAAAHRGHGAGSAVHLRRRAPGRPRGAALRPPHDGLLRAGRLPVRLPDALPAGLQRRDGHGRRRALLQSIGYIIPGLIAYWMLRQGIVETLCTMLMAAFIVRLALVVAHGGRLIELALG